MDLFAAAAQAQQRRFRGEQLCVPILGDWQRLATKIVFPKLVGGCGADPKDEASTYRLVRGFSEPELDAAGRNTRTLCIDPKTRLVVWERWENRYSARTFVYSTIDHPESFAEGTFEFARPSESTLTDFGLPTPGLLGGKKIPSAFGVLAPRLVSTVEPKYPETARRARIDGTTVVYAEIDRHRDLEDVLVYRSLSPDFDREAVRAVEQ